MGRELLSDLCLAWQITALGEQEHRLCDLAAIHFTDGTQDIESIRCHRAHDSFCPALATFLDADVDDCGGCDNLLRYDPSPPGVSLPAGFYTECGIPDHPSECPQKQWEDDVPSENLKGGAE